VRSGALSPRPGQHLPLAATGAALPPGRLARLAAAAQTLLSALVRALFHGPFRALAYAVGQLIRLRHVPQAALPGGLAGGRPVGQVAGQVVCGRGRSGAVLVTARWRGPCFRRPARHRLRLGRLGRGGDARPRLAGDPGGSGAAAGRPGAYRGGPGVTERPGTLVPVQQGGEQLRFAGIHAEHDTRTSPWFLD
jgi:hypothetical protein